MITLVVPTMTAALTASPLLTAPPSPAHPDGTAPLGLADWVAATQARTLPGADSTDRLLAGIGSGLAEADANALLGHEGPIGADPREFHLARGLFAAGLLRSLSALGRDLPNLSLRAAVGWRLVTQHQWSEEVAAGGLPWALACWMTGTPATIDKHTRGTTRFRRLLQDLNDTADTAGEDAVTALAEQGWRFAAAGIARAEAEALAGAGTVVDWDHLAGLAVLRGVTLPVTR